MSKVSRNVIRTLGGGALVLSLVACDSSQNTSFSSVKGDLSPNMQSTAERSIDIDKNIALANEMDGRSFWNDLGRAFYTDHPSRLSPWPITSLTGQPR